MPYEYSPRELLVDLGLAGLDERAGNQVVELFMEIAHLRVGSHLARLMGRANVGELEDLTGLKLSAQAQMQGLEFLEEMIPEASYIAEQEVDQLKAEFLQRLTAELAAGEDTL